MPNFRRYYIPNAIVFITCVTQDRAPLQVGIGRNRIGAQGGCFAGVQGRRGQAGVAAEQRAVLWAEKPTGIQVDVAGSVGGVEQHVHVVAHAAGEPQA